MRDLPGYFVFTSLKGGEKKNKTKKQENQEEKEEKFLSSTAFTNPPTPTHPSPPYFFKKFHLEVYNKSRRKSQLFNKNTSYVSYHRKCEIKTPWKKSV